MYQSSRKVVTRHYFSYFFLFLDESIVVSTQNNRLDKDLTCLKTDCYLDNIRILTNRNGSSMFTIKTLIRQYGM